MSYEPLIEGLRCLEQCVSGRKECKGCLVNRLDASGLESCGALSVLKCTIECLERLDYLEEKQDDLIRQLQEQLQHLEMRAEEPLGDTDLAMRIGCRRTLRKILSLIN